MKRQEQNPQYMADFIATTAMKRPTTLVEDPTLLPVAVNFSLAAVEAMHTELGVAPADAIEGNRNKRAAELQEKARQLDHSDQDVRKNAVDTLVRTFRNGADIWNRLQEQSRERVHQGFMAVQPIESGDLFERSTAHGD
jgi:hypothetical protein